MKHLLLTLLVCIAFVLPGCGGKATNSTLEDSQTHWLKECSRDSACGDLSCVCGRCVEECSNEDSCSVSARECFSARSKATAALCGDEKPAPVCLVECDKDKDCPGGQSCEAGACLPEENGGSSYDPCDGKACGDSCFLCDPDDQDCAETEEPKACNADGRCDDSPDECPGTAPVACSGLGEDECKDADGCRAFNGRTPGEEERFIECAERVTGQTCGNAQTCAARSGDLPVLFPTTCLPAGFEELDFEECDPESCEDRPIDECESALCAVVSGMDSEGKSVAVGCMAKTHSCPPEITCGRPETGGDSLDFGNCLPKGWVPCQSSEDPCAEQSAEECDPLSCRVLSGRNNAGEQEAVGCIDRSAGCDEALTCGIQNDPKVGPIFFSDGCMPAGWRSVDYVVCGEEDPQTGCSDVPLVDCRGACSLINGVDQPEAELKALGCAHADRDCGDALTCASQTADDVAVLFFDTCIPKGWVERPGEDCLHLQ